MTEPVNDEVHEQTILKTRAARERLRVGLTAMLLLLIALFITLAMFAVKLATPLGAPSRAQMPQGITWVRSIYGWGSGEIQQLYAPSDVAIAKDGTIWVADPQRWQVVGFNPDGSFKTILHRGPGRMMPQTIAVDDADNVYIGDYMNNKIRVFRPDNVQIRSWDTSLPTEVAVRDGRVVVGMVGAVGVYDENGKLLTFWGGRGRADNEVDVVRGVAIGDDGTIYISDTQNHRLKAYTQTGKLLWVYPSNAEAAQMTKSAEGTEAPEPPFQIPAGMTFDGKGRLVVADPFAFQLVVVDPKNGHVIARQGQYGQDDGFFSYPTSVAYDDARDYFAVADTANDRVQVLRIPGSGADPVSAVRRALVGPWWAWLLPLIALIAVLVARMIRRRRRDAGAEEDGQPSASPDMG